MKKIWLVLQREYLTRVRKKSFIIITFLGPIIMAAFIFLPAYLSKQAIEKQHFKVGLVNNISDLQLQSNDKITFVPLTQFTKPDTSAEKLSQWLEQNQEKYKDLDAILVISNVDQPVELFIINDKSIILGETISNLVQQAIQNYRLKQLNISPEQLAQIFAPVEIKKLVISAKGLSKTNIEERTAIAFIGALLIYFFVFLYGGLAMRSVMEEKVNRVVELIISSVRPFQLMAGKLLAILLIALTQFIIWIVFLVVLIKLSILILGQNPQFLQQFNGILSSLKTINPGLILTFFVFYFITGYLLYGALFAAIGAVVDVETDAQQFVFPLSLPLIIAIFALQTLMINPDSDFGFWMSIIPFTSPIVMIFRVAMGVPQVVAPWELVVSVILMIAFVIMAIWAAGKIFRIGILFYGKRPTYRDLWKWLWAKG